MVITGALPRNAKLMPPQIQIILADDHEVVRKGLRALLEAESDLSVIGEAKDGLGAIDLTHKLKPDVLVLDLLMPGLGGLDVARQVTKRSPKTRVVVLSIQADEAYVIEAFRNGASAYVLKDASAAELIHGIHEAAAGRRYLSAPFSDTAPETYLEKAKAPAEDPYDTLTPREREVLHLSAEGLTSAEISERLHISPRTAETHRAHALHKLGLKGQTDLVRYALKRGILSLEETGASKSRPRGRA